MKRPVEPVPEFLEEVLDGFRGPSVKCATGAEMLLEELETQNPSIDERCGLLADRYEIYGMSVPDCPRLTLVVSLDFKSDEPWTCIVHGLIPTDLNTCATGRALATRHFRLSNPTWEFPL